MPAQKRRYLLLEAILQVSCPWSLPLVRLETVTWISSGGSKISSSKMEPNDRYVKRIAEASNWNYWTNNNGSTRKCWIQIRRGFCKHFLTVFLNSLLFIVQNTTRRITGVIHNLLEKAAFLDWNLRLEIESVLDSALAAFIIKGLDRDKISISFWDHVTIEVNHNQLPSCERWSGAFVFLFSVLDRT